MQKQLRKISLAYQAAWHQVTHVQHQRYEYENESDRLQWMHQENQPLFVGGESGESDDVHGKGHDQDVCVTAVVNDSFDVPQNEYRRQSHNCK